MKSTLILGLLATLILTSSCGEIFSSTLDDDNTTTTYIQFTTFQSASNVIGQDDLVSKTSSSITAYKFDSPYGDMAYADSKLYIADYGANRVLGYDSVPTSDGAAADFVLGQSSFTASTTGYSANELYEPIGVNSDDSKFLITDYNNSRVLIYNSLPTSGPGTADVVVGQSDFSNPSSACDQNSLNQPWAAQFVDTKLIVSDSSNNRILIYNTIPTSNNATADIVIGQNSFTTCAANDADQNGSADTNPAANTLSYPTSIWSDGTKLIVLDSNNNRILIWNTLPTSNFDTADVVIGQSDFTTSTSNSGDVLASNFNFNQGNMHVNGDQLFVSDTTNNRVLIWNSFPTSDGTSADVVLGQNDFTSYTANDDDQDDVDDSAATGRTIYFPTGLQLIDNKLLVQDQYNYRILIYEGVETTL